jgi:ABC-type polysaccharide/polyol phosphate transport system ATPase subunit
MINSIVVQNLSKQFKIDSPVKRILLARFANVISGVGFKRKFLPLTNVSFDVQKGERIGIIGRNGAGKSTLLKLIAGVYKVETGIVQTSGEMILLTNLANGLKTRLSVKDNIFLVGGILGLSTRQIKKLFNKIVEFAGLHNFVYSKVYQLSSGMRQRLAFSTTMYSVEFLNPDIILLDEVVTGGGDEEFTNKSDEKISDLICNGKTVLLISHNLVTIKKFCKRVIWLDKGRVVKDGNPEDVINEYLQFVEK